MKEYIERDWLIDWFTIKGKDAEIINEVGQVPLPTIRENIKDAPAADVVEVRHGWWINKEVDEIMCHVYGNCSVCHERKRIDNFCPHCGAKMDKEE